MKPRMFQDEPAELKLKSAKKISDLKNLGPSSEVGFAKAGITLNLFKKHGWQWAMKKLHKSNPKNLHTMYAYALIGALKNQEWNAISDAEKKEAKEFCASLRGRPSYCSAKKDKSTNVIKKTAKSDQKFSRAKSKSKAKAK